MLNNCVQGHSLHGVPWEGPRFSQLTTPPLATGDGIKNRAGRCRDCGQEGACAHVPCGKEHITGGGRRHGCFTGQRPRIPNGNIPRGSIRECGRKFVCSIHRCQSNAMHLVGTSWNPERVTRSDLPIIRCSAPGEEAKASPSTESGWTQSAAWRDGGTRTSRGARGVPGWRKTLTKKTRSRYAKLP